MLKAERALVRACLLVCDGDPAAGTSFAAAVRGLRELRTPYHLAHGLLDHAQYLTGQGDTETARETISEARHIAHGPRCQPLLDRAGNITPVTSVVQD